MRVDVTFDRYYGGNSIKNASGLEGDALYKNLLPAQRYPFLRYGSSSLPWMKTNPILQDLFPMSFYSVLKHCHLGQH